MTGDSYAMHFGIWDEQARSITDAQQRENRIVADELRLGASDVVLDAGCGVCGTGIWMARNIGCQVTGITLSEKQSRIAERYIRRHKVGHRVNVMVRNMCDTGFDDASFTAICGIESVCQTHDKIAFLKEAYRLLKPGGRICVADGFLGSKTMAPADEKLYAECCEGWAVPRLETVEDFTAMMRQAGFADISADDRTKDTLRLARRVWYINAPLYPIYKFLYRLGLISRVSYMDVVASVNQRKVIENGIARYAILSGQKPL
jgi:cyclopropane fatty-acyl-phospholipid synthase-like methyltransferase